jgi:hypothetical protein
MDDLQRNKGWSVILRGHDLRLRDASRYIVAGSYVTTPLGRPHARLKFPLASFTGKTIITVILSRRKIAEISVFRQIPAERTGKFHLFPPS